MAGRSSTEKREATRRRRCFMDVVPHVPRPHPGFVRRLPCGGHDLPGFEFSEAPGRVRSSFDQLADVIDRFTTVAQLGRYVIYVSTTAPRWASASRRSSKANHCDLAEWQRLEEGWSECWSPIQPYWMEPTAERRASLRQRPHARRNQPNDVRRPRS